MQGLQVRQEVQVRVDTKGNLKYLYEDSIFEATRNHFEHSIYRASFVAFNAATQQWNVLVEEDGNETVLTGFNTYKEAVAAERVYLGGFV